MTDLEVLRKAAENPQATQFQPLPLLRLVLDLADRVEELERRAAPAKKAAPRKRKAADE